ncbi:MAG TPA: helix-turn-helix domain-containing protein [Acidobacteriota bacterium]|jgi:transcriptional regulator GlxA family with amidase domain|nr:helix-turn-helix domain-containing protein [Acidobacteriota bacterium]
MFHGESVRKLREELEWSQQELASYLRLTTKEVAALEHGLAQPTDEQIGALYRLAASKSIPFDPFRGTRQSVSAAVTDPFLDSRLRRVKTLVESLYSEPITLADAATAACLESKYFSKFFRKKVGMPFSTWLTDFRIRKAKELLTTSEKAILDIAYLSGFQSLRTFERQFKRHTEMTPKEFRAKRRAMSRM